MEPATREDTPTVTIPQAETGRASAKASSTVTIPNAEQRAARAIVWRIQDSGATDPNVVTLWIR